MGFDQANPAPEHSPAGCGQECPRSYSRQGLSSVRRRIAALPKRARKANGPGSAAVLGRINTMTDLAPVSIRQIRRPNIHLLGAGKNARAPIARWCAWSGSRFAG
ncbi:MAG: hypothetical protein ACP5MD_02450 [Verrucomicrobiia bacterium]